MGSYRWPSVGRAGVHVTSPSATNTQPTFEGITGGIRDRVVPSIEAPPAKSWFRRNIGDTVGRVAEGFKNVGLNTLDMFDRAAYRLGFGFGGDSYVDRAAASQRRKMEGQLGGAALSPAVVDSLVGESIGSRLLGDGSDRGDLYEHYASKGQGRVSTGWIGRALNASQPLPAEMGLGGNFFADTETLNPSAVPGVASILDYGSYFTPAMPYLFGADVAEKTVDGDYGSAVGYSVAPFLLGKAVRLASRIPRRYQPLLVPVAGYVGGKIVLEPVGDDLSRDSVRRSLWSKAGY